MTLLRSKSALAIVAFIYLASILGVLFFDVWWVKALGGTTAAIYALLVIHSKLREFREFDDRLEADLRRRLQRGSPPVLRVIEGGKRDTPVCVSKRPGSGDLPPAA